jgi:endonuclease/exonuclease/phosphatase family metal-dependent hydrolase
MRPKLLIGIVFCALLSALSLAAQVSPVPIGVIQGAADVSPYLNRFVNFSGVVVGRYEDENTRGDVYYTLFVQDLPETSDGDPATSDGIAVFLGREPRLDIAIGQRVTVGGKVTEFYGLTEIDDRGLFITLGESGPLPEATVIDPPAGMGEMASYFEALEGMRVAYDGAVVVAGPTHEGCGFAVIAEAAADELPAVRRADGDPVGRIVPVLYPSDRVCDDIPQVKSGDRLAGMAGALTYNFDQFKIVIDSAEQLAVEVSEMPSIPTIPALDPRQVSVATINNEDTFDTVRDTQEAGEPVPNADEVAARRAKLAHVISGVLHCPTLVALQEIEHEALLADLSAALSEACGFVYQVSHLESPDARGIDNALLSDPGRVVVEDVALRQTCSPVPTEIVDPSVACEAGQEPLFGRPPLQVKVRTDGEPYTIFVNHFKSKRGGETETGLERIHQAVYLNGLAAELLAADQAARVIALGDFNDTELSPALALMTDPAQGGRLTNVLTAIRPEERYTYNFGGVAELIDAILVSPALASEIGGATILHVNTDFPVGWRLDTSPERLPFRVTDHDIPMIILGRSAATPTPEPTVTTTVDDRPPTAELGTDDERQTTDDGKPTNTPTVELKPVVTAATEVPVERAPETDAGPRSVPFRSPWAALLIGGAILGLALVIFFRFRR